ncbi:hypothetical protein CG723_23415 [Streptomyces sp. CB01635]|nr:hypothetical protein CG723_23415 [Streptomyces sp. CB01635]
MGQAQDEKADGAHGAGAPCLLRLAGLGVLPVHQVAVPAQHVSGWTSSGSRWGLGGEWGQQRGEEGPLLGPRRRLVGAEMAFQEGDLVV